MATSVHKLAGQPVTLTWEYNVTDEPLIVHFRLDSSPLGLDMWTDVFGVGMPKTSRSREIAASAGSKNYRVVAVAANGLESTSNTVEVIIDPVPPPAPANLEVA
jgi:hypothetical protein